ncbi:MAG: GNAT family N-acetyltransferase [Gemmatimonadota bacterium]|nr:GNAT family N-acetyltransferase [Gemmatimonadota bacterium]
MELNNLGPDGAYRTRLLELPDMKAVQSLFDEASDYFEKATGMKPGPDEAKRAFVAGPPNKQVSDKRIIGVFDDQDALIGILDGLVDFPKDGEWTMGMLLLIPEARGRGIGGAVLDAYEQWASENGCKRFHTALMADMEQSAKFLENRGYRIARTVENYNAGGRTTNIQFFTKAAGGKR